MNAPKRLPSISNACRSKTHTTCPIRWEHADTRKYECVCGCHAALKAQIGAKVDAE